MACIFGTLLKTISQSGTVDFIAVATIIEIKELILSKMIKRKYLLPMACVLYVE